MTKRWTRYGLVLLLAYVTSGCTTTPNYNDPLTSHSPDAGYRFKNIERGENSDSLFWS